MSRPASWVVANWKMNLVEEPARYFSALGATSASDQRHIGVCPPSTVLAQAAAHLDGSHVKLGGQDCHPEDGGAFTGDVAAPHLRAAGADLVILGHSERRAGHAEDDALVARKLQSAQRHGLIGLLCVGETLDIRCAGRAEEVVTEQLLAALAPMNKSERLLVAYEPVWAIGTGLSARPEDIAIMHATLGQALTRRFGTDAAAIPLLYGGSVTPANADQIAALPRVDGCLVGGASLDVEAFLQIVDAVDKARPATC